MFKQLSVFMVLVLFVSILSFPDSIQSGEATYAERLGWSEKAVVVLFHIDDAGMSHASNMGVKEALTKGVGSSFSIMMPCSWVSEMADLLNMYPDWDSGLHLTLTAEWKSYRWGPLAGADQVPGLVDSQGCFWPSVRQVVEHATPDEVEREIRAQIARAERMAIPITHLDSHMGTLFAHEAFFERYLKIGIEKQIPVLIAGGRMTHARKENGDAVARLLPLARQVWNAGLPVLDDIHTDSYGWNPEEKSDRMKELLASLEPGVTEIILHASKTDDVLPVVTSSSRTRQGDLNCLMDPAVAEFIKERGIVVTTWKELMQRRKSARLIQP